MPISSGAAGSSSWVKVSIRGAHENWQWRMEVKREEEAAAAIAAAATAAALAGVA